MNLKMFCLIKKLLDTRIQAKKHKIETYEIDKISLSWFDDKRFVLDDEIHTLAYFIKIVLQTVKKFKKVVIKKKRLKKVVIIEKDCDNRKRLWQKKEILTDDHK